MTKRIEEGAIRFNTDSSKMEVWNGQKWMIVSVSSPNLDGGARGIVMGGNPGVNNIDFFTIPIAGNATDFNSISCFKFVRRKSCSWIMFDRNTKSCQLH